MTLRKMQSRRKHPCKNTTELERGRCVSVSAMAERLANHFACYRPASDLFLRLLDMDKVEDAKFMLAVSMTACVFIRICLRPTEAELRYTLVNTAGNWTGIHANA